MTNLWQRASVGYRWLS